MTSELTVLLATSASVAFVHAILGPDHYLPFVALAKAKGWSIKKTAVVTSLCGLGHILTSAALGMMGIALGLGIASIDRFDGFRAQIAAWGLIGFGLLYLVWGLRKAYRNRPHGHWHAHGKDLLHSHEHTHVDDHLHPHLQEGKAKLTPWVLFIIFAFGPCESLIPLLMYPAAQHSWSGTILVAGVFGAVT